jgi:hypothetical protein
MLKAGLRLLLLLLLLPASKWVSMRNLHLEDAAAH